MVTPQPTRIRILRFVKSFIASHGYRPTVREIGSAVGLKSTSTVSGHLKRLQRDGLLTLSPLKPRSIVLTEPSSQPKKPVRKFKVEHDDGTIGFLEFPVFDGMPEALGISHYTDGDGIHIVTKCTECT